MTSVYVRHFSRPPHTVLDVFTALVDEGQLSRSEAMAIGEVVLHNSDREGAWR